MLATFSEQVLLRTPLLLLLTQFLRVDMQTASPDPVPSLLLARWIIRRGLLNLLEVATLLLYLLLQELTADADIRVVEHLVEVLAHLDRALSQ